MKAKLKSLKYISGTLLCLGVFSTVTYASSTSKSLSSGVSPTWAVLGAPTLDATGMPTSTIICVDTTNSTVGSNPQAGFTLNSSVSGIELNSVLNLGVKAKLPTIESYGGLNASLSASFSANAKNTEYSYNYTYLYTYSSEATFPVVYGDASLSPSGKAALAAGLDAFMNTCGDSYVSSLRAGTVLAVDVKVTFQNKEEAESFAESAAAGGYGALGRITSYISSSQLAKNAVMSISAMQLGGTPESLNQILGYDSTTGGYYATACGVANSPAACQKTIDAILIYANTLPTQISGGTNLYYFNPVLSWYSKLGITNVPAPQPLSEETQAAQSVVINEINLSQSRIVFLSNYKQNSLPLKADVNNYIDKQIQTLQARIDYINSAAVNCFNAYAETCPRIVGDITKRIKSAPNAFGFSKENYNKLNSAWYYTYGNQSTYIVPVSLFGAYATVAGATDGALDKPGLAATAYSVEENGVSYVTQFDIPDIDYWIFPSYNTCLPASNDNKFATTRNFICTDGLFKRTPVQFIATTNPI